MSKTAGSFVALTFMVLAFAVSARAEIFTAYLTGAQEVPAVTTGASGYARINVNESAGTLTFTVVFNNLGSAQTASHIHAPAAIGANAAVAINFGTVGGTSGTISGSTTITPTQLAQLRAGQGYVNVHSVNNGPGEIRGQLNKPRPVDYDGDGRMDLSNLRFPNVAPPGLAQITYHNNQSTAGYAIEFFGNANTDFPVPGDYDGDGKGDIALYRDGDAVNPQSEFWIINSATGWVSRLNFGTNGDQAHCRDYDGDGKTDLTLYRRGAAANAPVLWYILQSSNNSVRIEHFGLTPNGTGTAGDTPVSGDYDGDGKFDLAVYRFGTATPTNTFIYKQSSDNVIKYQTFGNFTSDYILPGDYDGDGKTDLMAGRTGAVATSPMVWHLLRSSDGGYEVRGAFGISSDVPVQGDYDGDGRTDMAVYRSGVGAGAASVYWILNSHNLSVTRSPWGITGDFAVGTFDAR